MPIPEKSSSTRTSSLRVKAVCPGHRFYSFGDSFLAARIIDTQDLYHALKHRSGAKQKSPTLTWIKAASREPWDHGGASGAGHAPTRIKLKPEPQTTLLHHLIGSRPCFP